MPTVRSSSTQRSRTSLLPMVGLWMSSASASWSPMENMGVSADSGSWKTIEMDLPRKFAISSSVLPMSSSPANFTEPVTCALSSRSPMRESAVTDLPEPDSPTMPSVRPRHRSKLTLRTASTLPASVLNETLRLRTLMMGSPVGTPLGPLPSRSSFARVSSLGTHDAPSAWVASLEVLEVLVLLSCALSAMSSPLLSDLRGKLPRNC